MVAESGGMLADVGMARIRHDIPLLETITYLNSASCSPPPAPVVAAMTAYYTETPVNYRSGKTPFERDVTDRVNAVRESIASSLGAASAAEVVFTKNTTEAINMVAGGMDWAEGDEIVTTPIEHQSNLIPWIRLGSSAGVRLRFVTPAPDGRVDPDALADVMTERTRLVAVHHVSNILGVIQDIPSLSEMAHRGGALLLVDAAQSEGRIPVHVPTLACDFLVSCARKGLMGPQGVGFLWGREELLRKLQPLAIGGQAAQVMDPDSYRLLDPPYSHEPGILNTAGVIGFGAALDYAESVDRDTAGAHLAALVDSLVEQLVNIDGVVIHSSADRGVQAGVLSWSVLGRDPLAIAEALYERGRIVVAAGSCGSPLATRFIGVDSVVRSSLHHFNAIDDVDHLVGTLKSILQD